MTDLSAPLGPTAAAPAGRRQSPTFAIYKLLLTQQVTRARVLMLTGAGLIGVFVALLLRNAGQSQPDQVGALLIAFFGLEIFVPVTALLFACATLGEANDDGTLVYLWLRPVARGKIVAAAILSSLTAALPITLVALLAAAAVSGAGTDLLVGVLVTVPLSLVAYSSLFCALGLRSRRALIWGLLYIFIWEGFVARGGGTVAHLAIRCYSETMLARITGADLDQAIIDGPKAWIVPIAVAVVAALYTTWRLRRQDIA